MCIYKTKVEKNKKLEINKLMRAWKNLIKTKGKIVFPDDGKKI